MKAYLKACIMAIRTYCAFPFKAIDDDASIEEKERSLMTLCLPIVGLIIGAVWVAIYYVIRILVLANWFPIPIAAALFAIYPFFATRFMHLSGMKESSKITIMLVCLCAGLSLNYESEEFIILLLLPIITRCCYAITVSVMPPKAESVYAGEYQNKVNNQQLAFIITCLVVSAFAGTVMARFYGFVFVAALIGYFVNLMRQYKKNEGMNGEIAGYALVKAETWGIVMFALVEPLTNEYSHLFTWFLS